MDNLNVDKSIFFYITCKMIYYSYYLLLWQELYIIYKGINQHSTTHNGYHYNHYR